MSLIKKLGSIKTPIKYALTGVALTYTLTGCATRMTLDEANRHQGTINEYVKDFVTKEGIMDGSEANRENRCFKDLRDKEIGYTSKAQVYNTLSSCVDDKKLIDMLGWGAAAVVVDGAKLWYIIEGIRSEHGSKEQAKPKEPYSQPIQEAQPIKPTPIKPPIKPIPKPLPPVETIGIGSSSGSTADVITSGIGPGSSL